MGVVPLRGSSAERVGVVSAQGEVAVTYPQYEGPLTVVSQM